MRSGLFALFGVSPDRPLPARHAVTASFAAKAHLRPGTGATISKRPHGEGAAMALPAKAQLVIWGATFAVLLGLLWLLGDVLLPYVTGGAIAYFLDPVADRLERLGMGRAAATTLIAVLALFVVLLLVLAIVPALLAQLAALANATPEIVRQLQGYLLERFPELGDSTSTIRQTLASIAAAIQAKGGQIAGSLIGSVMGVVSALVFVLVVPVVAFYLLLDWDRMIARIDALLPRDHAPVIRRLAREIDAVLAGFVRGQLSVCIALGSFYALALVLAGLQFGLVVGAIAGAITFIPYVGSLVGGTLAIGLALAQFWGDWLHVGTVAAVFVAGQFLEGNILTPRLVGRSVGLHPVWLLFSLSAFGWGFGFVGMLVAVPAAAAIGVLARFGIERYSLSPLYAGRSPGADGDPPPADRDDPP